jgi:microcystin-dependent protein
MSTSPTYGGLQPASLFGDIKAGRQPADHVGWILCNGRLKSTLTTTQQAVATALGIGANIDDARGKALFAAGANGIVLGATGGAATATVAQANLPNVSLIGGNHGHSITDPGHSHSQTEKYRVGALPNSGQPNWGSDPGGSSTYTGNLTSANATGISVAASGNLSIPLGGSGTALPVQNPYLGVNVFIYLGT